MTLQETVQHGIELARTGNLAAALAVFRGAHETFPDNPHTDRLIGAVLHNMGQTETALPHMIDGIRRNCIPAAVFELCLALLSLGRLGDVQSICEQTKLVIPDEPAVLAMWADALYRLSHPAEAVPLLQRALAIIPDEPTLLHNLSASLAGSGRGEEAVAVFARTAKPWAGSTAMAPDLVKLDAVADGYDDNEIHGYFSRRLMALYQQAFGARAPGRVLDLGCGTGLLATRLPASASALVGIDLSPAMLAKTRARGGYTQLVQGDLMPAMAGLTASFDTIVASCVLYYFADLQPILGEAVRLLASGGALLFSVDATTDDHDITVTKFGEYCHSRAYLRRLAGKLGLAEAIIAIDRHRGPPGFWCAFTKG